MMIANFYYYGLGGENDLVTLVKYANVYARDTAKCDVFCMSQSQDISTDVVQHVKTMNMRMGAQCFVLWNY